MKMVRGHIGLNPEVSDSIAFKLNLEPSRHKRGTREVEERLLEKLTL